MAFHSAEAPQELYLHGLTQEPQNEELGHCAQLECNKTEMIHEYGTLRKVKGECRVGIALKTHMIR